jgi:hypothetical protein
MSYWPAGAFTICPVCAGLAGHPEGRERHPQVCRCAPAGAERWPDHDFNEYAALCWCCLLEAIPSGSKFSPFYCRDCLQRAQQLNSAAGRTVLFIGRHSLMASVGPPGPDAGDPPSLTAFPKTLTVFIGGISGFYDAMNVWRPGRLRTVLSGLEPGAPAVRQEPVALDTYLQAAARLVDHPQLGKRAAFSALCRHLGLPAPEHIGL